MRRRRVNQDVAELQVRRDNRSLLRDRTSKYVRIRGGTKTHIADVDSVDPSANGGRCDRPRNILVDEETRHLLYRVDFFFL